MNPIVSPKKTFVFEKYSFNRDSGEVALRYLIDNEVFVERVVFPLPATSYKLQANVLDRALFSLHLIGGISYYKAFLPPSIIVNSGALTEGEAAFWNKTYTLGLGEFFYRNDLDGSDYVHFPSSRTKNERDTSGGHMQYAPTSDILVPIGGGKDSFVTIEKLREAGKNITLVALGAHGRLREGIAATGLPALGITRTLDPKLFALNAEGALNGHVPISAYIACASVVLAAMHGVRDIALSNERSANVGNTVVDGLVVNHQYSKSLEFERDFQAYVASSITPSVRYFSLLRPWSELRIVKEFVARGKYFDVFSSCNGNFTITKVPGSRWCGTCPKCAFVFALFAAFCDRATLERIFGAILFDNADLVPLYNTLVGKEGIKPFECVGEPEEVVAAFALCARRGELRDTPVMRYATSDVLATVANVDSIIDAALAPSPDHAIPDEYTYIVL